LLAFFQEELLDIAYSPGVQSVGGFAANDQSRFGGKPPGQDEFLDIAAAEGPCPDIRSGGLDIEVTDQLVGIAVDNTIIDNIEPGIRRLAVSS
jgi:hypothetical protein